MNEGVNLQINGQVHAQSRNFFFLMNKKRKKKKKKTLKINVIRDIYFFFFLGSGLILTENLEI